jgi:hypothetical protein
MWTVRPWYQPGQPERKRASPVASVFWIPRMKVRFPEPAPNPE